MSRARVVLVDDDASIRHLMTMALADLPIELVVCAGGAEAIEALREAPAALLITDLMMPGMSGFELLQRLADEPALRGGARLAVFSAGLNAQARAQLAELDVSREITKPVSVLALMAFVEQAVAPGSQAGLAALESAPKSREPLPAQPRDAAIDEAAAIRHYFAGNAELFHAFKAGCAAQFQDDLRQLRAAVEHHDSDALRRLAHSLKSVLMTLGHTEASGRAGALERAAVSGDRDVCATHGAALGAALEALLQPGSDVR